MAAQPADLTFVVDDRDQAERAASAIGANEALVLEKRGLAGSPAEWLLVITVTSRTVLSAARVALQYLELKRVASIQFGDKKFEKLRDSDVDRVLDLLEKSMRDE